MVVMVLERGLDMVASRCQSQTNTEAGQELGGSKQARCESDIDGGGDGSWCR